jgi:hypothetical protein
MWCLLPVSVGALKANHKGPLPSDLPWTVPARPFIRSTSSARNDAARGAALARVNIDVNVNFA